MKINRCVDETQKLLFKKPNRIYPQPGCCQTLVQLSGAGQYQMYYKDGVGINE
jgi:hypothetical protein